MLLGLLLSHAGLLLWLILSTDDPNFPRSIGVGRSLSQAWAGTSPADAVGRFRGEDYNSSGFPDLLCLGRAEPRWDVEGPAEMQGLTKMCPCFTLVA